MFARSPGLMVELCFGSPAIRHRRGTALTLLGDAAYLSPSRFASPGSALPPMQILFADYDFPDIDLEREIFSSAGLTLKLAQCKTDAQVIDAAKGCGAILLQYAPITR